MSTTLTFSRFLATAPGLQLTQWESERFKSETADVFGYDALQVGLPDFDTLIVNRIARHWITVCDESNGANIGEARRAVVAHPTELPFDNETFDLVTLPHTLDVASEPQHVLREAVRVLCPEGRLVLALFNPLSLWWLRQKRISLGAKPYLPSTVHPIALPRIKDWLGLLGLQIDRGYFGLYTPACTSRASFEHWAWLNKAGDRWAPQCANLVILSAVKRVANIKLVGRIDTIKKTPPLIPGAARCGAPSRKTPVQ